MSLYSAIFGKNKYADLYLSILGFVMYPARFRDCYLDLDTEETRIVIYARIGGTNRVEYAGAIKELMSHPNYLSNKDDEEDSTYAHFTFSIPEVFKAAIARNIEVLSACNRNPTEAWKKVLEGVEKGDTDNPDVKKALEVGEQVMGKITKGGGGIIEI